MKSFYVKDEPKDNGAGITVPQFRHIVYIWSLCYIVINYPGLSN